MSSRINLPLTLGVAGFVFAVLGRGCSLQTHGELESLEASGGSTPGAGGAGATAGGPVAGTSGNAAAGGFDASVEAAAGQAGIGASGGSNPEGGSAGSKAGAGGMGAGGMGAGGMGAGGMGGSAAQAGVAGAKPEAGPDAPACPCVSCTGNDEDKDKVDDGCDNCPQMPNPQQNNNDNDAVGNACEESDPTTLAHRVWFEPFTPAPLPGWNLGVFSIEPGAVLLDRPTAEAMFYAFAPPPAGSGIQAVTTVIDVEVESPNAAAYRGVGVGLRATDDLNGIFFMGCWVSLSDSELWALFPATPGCSYTDYCHEAAPCGLCGNKVALPTSLKPPLTIGIRALTREDTNGYTHAECLVYDPQDPAALPAGTQWATAATSIGYTAPDGQVTLFGIGVRAHVKSVDLVED